MVQRRIVDHLQNGRSAMWRARVSGFLVGLGVFLALSGWYLTDIADKAAFATLVLVSLAALIAASIVRRRANAPTPLASMLRWFGVVAIVTSVLGYMIVMSRGVGPERGYAMGDLSTVQMAQLSFLLDSNRSARTIAELGDRYKPTSVNYQRDKPIAIRTTQNGWVADVYLPRSQQTCLIYDAPDGSPPVAPATEPGKPACTTEPHGTMFWVGWLVAAAGVALGVASMRLRPAPALPPSAAI